MNEAKTQTAAPAAPKKGRPAGTKLTPKAAQGGITVTVEGDEVIIRLPKKDLSRKLLADLI